MSLLDEVAEKIGALDPDGRRALVEKVAPLKERMRFVPLPGPQTEAYLSEADVLLYGGQAGGGKSFLLMGLASQEHTRAIIFRREAGQTDGLVEAGKQIIGDTARFNGSEAGEWNWPNGRNVKLAGIKEPGDWNKHAGRERDFYGFDEAGEFLRDQVASLVAWNRGPEGQRCRIVLASNPPRSSDGYWMTEWFAPWLDLQRPDRAEPGELRWAVLLDGAPVWVEGPDAEYYVDGERRSPLSFTFIPAALSDNPYRDTPEYRAKIDSLPEPLRSQLKHGDFSAGVQDEFNQCIPTEWAKAAQRRWKPTPPVGVPMCSMGVDVAQGGLDQTVIAIRFDDWFAPLLAIPGAQTPGGSDVAGAVMAKRHDNASVVVDLGGGWGGEALAHLTRNGIDATGYMGVKESVRRTKDNQLRFFNVRTEAYWRLREALDPDQLGGATMALPEDKELLADLTAPTFTTRSGKGGMVIQLEAKDALVKRLGRSPDKADAVVMAWWMGARNVTDGTEWRAARPMRGPMGRTPKVIMGHQAKRR
ncbi:MAG: terminase family protein [Sedimentisphaerales bacterium]|nr:terminase family protein [Sedimentisphaerales bacterium]